MSLYNGTEGVPRFSARLPAGHVPFQADEGHPLSSHHHLGPSCGETPREGRSQAVAPSQAPRLGRPRLPGLPLSSQGSRSGLP